MTLAEFAKGSATFLVVIVAGLLSETYLDRHLAAREADKKAASSDSAEASAPSTSVGGMRRERRLLEKLAVVERADIIAEMPQRSLVTPAETARRLVAEADGRLAGLVTVAPDSGYIDQIVVATAAQRRGVAARLIAAARAVSPTVLELHVNQDNEPAVAFYRREGFAVSGEAANPRSGAPTLRMTWRA